MSFPISPEMTDDEKRSALLRLMGVRQHPGVYVLGSFARYVTVYAQQVRALNLIDTLAKSGELSRHSRVAVIGGGIAGLTAAAAAAVRGVGKVLVFEKRENTMRLQRASEKRYIHPHIYDWPSLPAFGNDAGLPLMNWEANRAADVVAHLDKQWHSLRDLFKDCLEEPRCNCQHLVLKVGADGPTVEVEPGSRQSFDVVILAVGFGLDKKESTDGYWTDTRLDGLEVETDQTWLVSGAGDGALTDLMRLCIMDFRHQHVLEAVDKSTREIVGTQLLEIETGNPSPTDLVKGYQKAVDLIAPELDKKFTNNELIKRTISKIWLNCSEKELFSQKSSVLNRLIVAYLYFHKKQFTLIDGHIHNSEINNGRYTIKFKDEFHENMEVDHVIERHGPDKALKQSFSEIWKACGGPVEEGQAPRGVYAEWQSARQYEDWTRRPLYEYKDFDPHATSRMPLRVDFDNQIGCVVLIGSRQLGGLQHKEIVSNALETFATRSGSGRFSGRRIEKEPECITMEEALSSSAAYERAVRALCETEIAVFDITGLESPVMLFLGIRAAVRRGVTITLTQDDPTQNPLPFNITQLNPIRLKDKGNATKIAAAFEQGFDALKIQPDTYLDLPVFDAVRRLCEEHQDLEPDKQILILRWFDPHYSKFIGELIDTPINNKFDEREPPVVTTLDSRSPQLVGQRLYAAIRLTKLCIADWTGWRPNVFFELGVRLAVNKIDPISIYCEDAPVGWEEEKSKWPAAPDKTIEDLIEFFKPTKFKFGKNPELESRINNSLKNAPSRVKDAKLSPGRTYNIVSKSIKRHEEPGGCSVDEFLEAEARLMAGLPGQNGGNSIPALFADELGEQVRQMAAEYVLAAWAYLDDRHKLRDRWESGTLPKDDLQFATFKRLGQNLRSRLENVSGKKYAQLKAEISEVLDRFDRWEKGALSKEEIQLAAIKRVGQRLRDLLHDVRGSEYAQLKEDLDKVLES